MLDSDLRLQKASPWSGLPGFLQLTKPPAQKTGNVDGVFFFFNALLNLLIHLMISILDNDSWRHCKANDGRDITDGIYKEASPKYLGAKKCFQTVRSSTKTFVTLQKKKKKCGWYNFYIRFSAKLTMSEKPNKRKKSKVNFLLRKNKLFFTTRSPPTLNISSKQ